MRGLAPYPYGEAVFYDDGCCFFGGNKNNSMKWLVKAGLILLAYKDHELEFNRQVQDAYDSYVAGLIMEE